MFILNPTCIIFMKKGETSILPFFFLRGIKRIELINSFNIQWKEG